MAVSQDTPSRGPISGVSLAIDYGQKRLGLALSDELGTIARPFAVWTRTNRRRDLARLHDLVRAQHVRRVIVGLPLHEDGSGSEMSREAQAFAARVQKALGIPVEMMDERLSSWEAEELRGGQRVRAGTSRRQAGKVSHGSGRVDDVAAAVILRDYLGHPGAARKITPAPANDESAAPKATEASSWGGASLAGGQAPD